MREGFAPEPWTLDLCHPEGQQDQRHQNHTSFSLRAIWDLFPYTCSLLWSSVHLCVFVGHKRKPMHYLHLFRHKHRCWVTVQLWDSFKEKTQLLSHRCDNFSHFDFVSRFFCAHGTLLSCKCFLEERLFFQRLCRVKAVTENKIRASSVGTEIFYAMMISYVKQHIELDLQAKLIIVLLIFSN